jgi:dipeptidyl aminopeptidase/acylaminoacyl peptidase
MVKKDANAGSGRVYDQLFVRHWDSWSNGDRSQLFAFHCARRAVQRCGDRSGKLVGDTPSKPYGGSEEVSWSADGKTSIFALREAGRIEPTLDQSRHLRCACRTARRRR